MRDHLSNHMRSICQPPCSHTTDRIKLGSVSSSSARHQVVSLVIHARRQEIFTGSVDGAIRVWSMTIEPLRILSHPAQKGAVDALAFSLDDKLFSGCEDGTINIWSPQTGQRLLELTGHTEDVVDMCVSPRTNHLISASRDNTAMKW